MSRQLGPATYAEFSVLYALMIALSRPVSILSTAITRVSVSGIISGMDFGKINSFSVRLGITVALIISLVPILLSPLISIFLKVDNLLLYLPLALTLFLWSLTGILRGLFTSVESFGLLSFAAGIEAFTRAACGILLVLWGFQSLGALLGSALGSLALFIFLLGKKNRIIELYNARKQQGSSDNSLNKITFLAFFVTVPTGFFLELDVLLAKRFFLSEEAGIYAAAALVGKSLLLFSTLASAVVYPKLVEEKLNRKGMFAFLWGIGITIILFASGYLFLLVFGKPLVGLLFGEKFSGVIGLVPLYTVAVMPLAVHLQIASFKSAVGGWTEGIWLWFVLAGYYLTLEMFSSTFYSYLQAIFIFHLLAAPISFIVLYLKNRNTDNKTMSLP